MARSPARFDRVSERDRLFAVWPALAAAAAYANSLPGILFWDSEILILKNVFLRSFRYIPKILTTSVMAGAGEITNYYRPLPVLLFLLQYQAWGTSALGYHAVNVLLHAGNCALLFFWARSLGLTRDAALAAGLLFALHPLQAETVNYVDHQEGMLALLFGLSALLCRQRRPALSVFFWICCLCSKEEGVVFAPILCALEALRPEDGTPCAAGLRGVLERLRPWRLHACVFVAYVALHLTAFNFLRLPLLHFGAQRGAYAVLPLRVLTFAKVLLEYLKLVVWPSGLHFDRDIARVSTIFDASAWRALSIDAFVFLVLWSAARPFWLARLGLFWFLAGLLPYAGILPFNNVIAEHFLYIPLAGLALAAAAAGDAAARRWLPDRRWSWAPALALLLALWTASIWRYNRVWQSPITVYRTTLAGNPGSYRAANNLGVEYVRARQFPAAKEAFEQALRIRPRYAPSLNNIGAVVESQGKQEEALSWYQRSSEADPTYEPAHRNVAATLYRLGRHREALERARAALARHPEDVEALDVVGAASLALGDPASALKAFLQSGEISPCARTFENIARAYARLGRMPEASEMLRRAKRLAPKKP